MLENVITLPISNIYNDQLYSDNNKQENFLLLDSTFNINDKLIKSQFEEFHCIDKDILNNILNNNQISQINLDRLKKDSYIFSNNLKLFMEINFTGYF